MDSNKHHHHHQHHHHNHNQQHQPQQPPQQNMNSGLTRYRSAPSSYFSNLINNGVYGDEDLDPFFNSRIPETNRNLSSFMSGDDNLSSHQNLDHIREQQQQMMYQNHVHNNNSSVVSSSSSSAAMVDPLMGTNLVRQSSSPAGVLEHINIDNGYPMMRSMDRFQPSVPDSTFSSASRASSRLLSRIPEHDGKTMTRNNGGYVGSFDVGSWDESSMLSDGFMNEFVESDQQKLNDEGRVQSVHAPTGLTHQLSLPTSSTELYVKEEQFQDSVLLRSRAKRGCATHPRSIAERVRRTRISERMRKLQDLDQIWISKQVQQTCWIWLLIISKNFRIKLRLFQTIKQSAHVKES